MSFLLVTLSSQNLVYISLLPHLWHMLHSSESPNLTKLAVSGEYKSKRMHHKKRFHLQLLVKLHGKEDCQQLCGHLNGNCYTWTGYLNLHQSFYNPPFCLQTKDRNAGKCCLMILGVYNLRMTSDSPIPRTRKAHHCEVQTALPATLPHSGLPTSSSYIPNSASRACNTNWMFRRLACFPVRRVTSSCPTSIRSKPAQVRMPTLSATNFPTLYQNSSSDGSDCWARTPVQYRYICCGG